MAAQLLSGQGFREVYNLKGGIKAWQGVKAVGPVELNLDLIRGDESPLEIISLAYGMEEALRRFYVLFQAAAAPTGSFKDLFTLLASVEEKHKELLEGLYLDMPELPREAEPLEEKTASPKCWKADSGLTDFIRENEPR